MVIKEKVQVYLSENATKYVDAKIKELNIDVSRSMMINGLIEQMIKDGKQYGESRKGNC